MYLELVTTAAACAAVWWTIFQLPKFWRAPRPAVIPTIGLSPERTARGIPALALLGTPFCVVVATVAWALPESDTAGVAEWLQTVIGIWASVLFVVPLGIGLYGGPRFAVPPALRGDLRDAPFHDATVVEFVGTSANKPFAVLCECGWMSDEHPTEAAARCEASAHTSRVRMSVDRVG